ncbi:hypothetical protein EV284_6474 [Streptomyces sp. BK022]|uniref:hypothetical protein n=1 Tax=Streptomyces sp. BK022 TaxID=2512123 RepID=UPI0010E29C20|nr:hypothetical protein [Streptomyces sp. BK022]RZU28308.1 hypothetical protein EV284_6474 [Streptomyces sp. BK022]
MSQTGMPAVETVAVAAQQIVDRIKGDPEFGAFEAASLEYGEDWQCFTGFPVVSLWKLETDAAPLFEEGLRALALKAAVYAATGDDKVAEVAIAVPVDEMTHAMLAQTQLFARIAVRCGVGIIHQTDQEHTDYRSGGYTYDCYRAAWGEPPARYWLDHEEVERRRDVLAGRYESIGVGRSGREHSIDFATVAA